MNDRLVHLRQFYALMAELEKRCGGSRILSRSAGDQSWPARGVSFFFEPGEDRTTSGIGARVVHIGTHAVMEKSKSTLWNRLSQHQGAITTGGGNHRGSIFRLLIGEALAHRDSSINSSTWGQGSTASSEIRREEHPLEVLVSQYLGSMPLLWLAVPDAPSRESKRAYIKRNAIALLSNWGREGDNAIDPPSRGWLGRFSPRSKVKNSGLWNQEHIDESYDPAFLDMFSDLMEMQE